LLIFIYLTPFRFLLVTPSPFIPLPLDKGKGDEVLERGRSPLSYYTPSSLEEESII
jgi:hypothetical protein